jgi:hypothetical protein
MHFRDHKQVRGRGICVCHDVKAVSMRMQKTVTRAECLCVGAPSFIVLHRYVPQQTVQA